MAAYRRSLTMMTPLPLTLDVILCRRAVDFCRVDGPPLTLLAHGAGSRLVSVAKERLEMDTSVSPIFCRSAVFPAPETGLDLFAEVRSKGVSQDSDGGADLYGGKYFLSGKWGKKFLAESHLRRCALSGPDPLLH